MIKTLILLISVVAIVLGLVVALAGPGTRFGVWEYTTGLQILRSLALPLIVAAGLSVICVLVALFSARGIVLLPVLATLIAGGAAYAPIKMKSLAEANPFIHDITTDFTNPPPIIAGASAERKNPAAYVGDEPAPKSEMTTAEAQRDAFPDIETLVLTRSVDKIAADVSAVIEEMGMEIIDNTNTENGRLIEATYKSAWFGFVDDFVVRLDEDGDKTNVDVRSKSRVGVSDLGANAQRVRTFTEKLKAAAG